jgi:hypothetical protein
MCPDSYICIEKTSKAAPGQELSIRGSDEGSDNQSPCHLRRRLLHNAS